MPENNAKTSVKTGPNRQMLRRTLFLMAVCGIAAFLILLGRLYKLQIADHEYYEKLAISQQLREAPTAAARGKIYDTNMNILAVSATVDNVYVSPAEIEMYGEDRALIASGLADILGLDYNDVYEKTGQTGSWYVTVKRKVEGGGRGEDTRVQIRKQSSRCPAGDRHKALLSEFLPCMSPYRLRRYG